MTAARQAWLPAAAGSLEMAGCWHICCREPRMAVLGLRALPVNQVSSSSSSGLGARMAACGRPCIHAFHPSRHFLASPVAEAKDGCVGPARGPTHKFFVVIFGNFCPSSGPINAGPHAASYPTPNSHLDAFFVFVFESKQWPAWACMQPRTHRSSACASPGPEQPRTMGGRGPARITLRTCSHRAGRGRVCCPGARTPRCFAAAASDRSLALQPVL